jgi:hypothetical protein
MKGSNNNPVPPLTPQNNIYKIIDLIASKTFKFESEAYKSGFGKPLMFGKEILVVPYYDIVTEEVREDVTNKEKPREVKPETRLVPVQKVRYIIDTKIFANEGLVYICKVNSLDSAKTLLTEYLRTIQIGRHLKAKLHLSKLEERQSQQVIRAEAYTM